ncbi:MAG TPA: hypothetical protein VEF34_20905 [Syntrophobacteraceae bacterium]|nr:hypothetical protein [Syntrophobacteraceae bacterium]
MIDALEKELKELLEELTGLSKVVKDSMVHAVEILHARVRMGAEEQTA